MPTLETAVELSSFAGRMNQTLRRLRQYGAESEWVSTVLDAVASFGDAAAVFALENGHFRLRGAHGLDLPNDLTFPLSLGRAFETAAATKDTVVALRTTAEVTSHLSSSDLSDRSVLTPILNGPRVAAVLFAVTKTASQSPALELVAGMASSVLERQSNSTLNVQISPALPVSSAPAAVSPVADVNPSAKLPHWANLGDEERRLHLRAGRFARVKVAEMQLFQADACRAGREQDNLYLFLKKEIDAARDSYRDQFLARPGMEDYLHLELIRMAADGDENKLGVDYPGHLG